MEKNFLPEVKINLKSERIVLKNFTLKNINTFYINWFNGKNEILKNSRHYRKKYQRNILVKNFISSQNSSIFIGIFDKKSNNLIGTMIAKKELNNTRLNIGILIGNKDYFSKGFAFESLNIFINFIFKKNKYKSIIFGTNKKNLSMIKLAKKFKVTKKISKFNSSVIFELKKNN